MAIGMQLVKYKLHLLARVIWPAIHSCRRGQCGFGTGYPPCLYSPGRSPKRSCGHRYENDNGQRSFRRQPVPHGMPLVRRASNSLMSAVVVT